MPAKIINSGAGSEKPADPHLDVFAWSVEPDAGVGDQAMGTAAQ